MRVFILEGFEIKITTEKILWDAVFQLHLYYLTTKRMKNIEK
jgi:hypothetical protein